MGFQMYLPCQYTNIDGQFKQCGKASHYVHRARVHQMIDMSVIRAIDPYPVPLIPPTISMKGWRYQLHNYTAQTYSVTASHIYNIPKLVFVCTHG